MRSILRLALVLSPVSLGAAGIPEAQEGLTKRDRQGPVTVTITLTTPPGTTMMDHDRWSHFWGAAKDFTWGLLVFDLYLGTLREQRKYADAFDLFVLGQFVGLPVMNAGLTLRLRPHLFPELKSWKRRLLTERDITDLLV